MSSPTPSCPPVRQRCYLLAKTDPIASGIHLLLDADRYSAFLTGHSVTFLLLGDTVSVPQVTSRLSSPPTHQQRGIRSHRLTGTAAMCLARMHLCFASVTASSQTSARRLAPQIAWSSCLSTTLSDLHIHNRCQGSRTRGFRSLLHSPDGLAQTNAQASLSSLPNRSTRS